MIGLFEYDAAGQRVRKEMPVQSKCTVYMDGLYEYRNESGSETFVHYVLADGDVVAQVDRTTAVNAEKVSYLHSDHLGTVSLVTTSKNGTVEATGPRFLDPFGNEVDMKNPKLRRTAPSPLGSVKLGFTGHEEDFRFELVNMKGRIYDPKVGRFLTPDPILSGLHSQALNRYSYVENDPVNSTDPTGFEPRRTSTHGTSCDGKLCTGNAAGEMVFNDDSLVGPGKSGKVDDGESGSTPTTGGTSATGGTSSTGGGTSHGAPGQGGSAESGKPGTKTISDAEAAKLAAQSWREHSLQANGLVGGGAVVGGYVPQVAPGAPGAGWTNPTAPPAIEIGPLVFDVLVVTGQAAIVAAVILATGALIPGDTAKPYMAEDKENDQGAGKTEHAEQRAREARQGDTHRQFGDANRVVREGRQFVDSETGNTIYVKGDRAVVKAPDGKQVTQFRNSRSNTQERIRTGKWVPR